MARSTDISFESTHLFVIDVSLCAPDFFGAPHQNSTNSGHACLYSPRCLLYVVAMRCGVICVLPNACLLRGHLHAAFDQPKFMIVPKITPTDAICAINDRSTESRRGYHNPPLQFLSAAAAEFLLARFVWPILRLIEAFLRRQVLRKPLLSSSEEPGYTDPEQYARYILSGARSRSARKKS